MRENLSVRSQQVEVQLKSPRRLNVQMDELWSFVDCKGNEQWVWLALDVETREDCRLPYWRPFRGVSESTLAILAKGVPPICSVLQRFLGVLPGGTAEQAASRPVGKETGLTSDIERFNNTLRQRVSRWVRKTLSFSKDLNNHIAAI